jgi:hypothetical protein
VPALGRPARRAPPERRTNVLVLDESTTGADVRALVDRVLETIEGCGPGPVVCDVAAMADPDARTVEALARLQLAAVRLGRRLRFVNASDELQGLLALTGLADVLPCDQEPCGPSVDDASGLEPLGEAEQREEALRFEEERDARDPSIGDLEDL